MKKILFSLLAVALAFGLQSCSKDDDDNEKEETPVYTANLVIGSTVSENFTEFVSYNTDYTVKSSDGTVIASGSVDLKNNSNGTEIKGLKTPCTITLKDNVKQIKEITDFTQKYNLTQNIVFHVDCYTGSTKKGPMAQVEIGTTEYGVEVEDMDKVQSTLSSASYTINVDASGNATVLSNN